MKRINPGIPAVLALTAMLFLSSCSVPAAALTDKPLPSATTDPAASSGVAPTPNVTAETPASSTETPEPTATPETTARPTKAPIVHDGAPDIIGLYVTDRPGYRPLVTDFTDKWVKGKDIAEFDSFASQDKVLKGNYKTVFISHWYKFPKAKEYKIGYCLRITLKSAEVITLTIRSPKDAPKDPKRYFYQFIEVYLYDDIHQKGWYSHLVESKMKKGMIMTTIKLTAGSKIKEVESAKLTAFVYKDDSDFDSGTGMYIGNTSYEIAIRNGK